MSKGVLYISYDGMTDNLGQSQVIPYMAGLSKAGYTIHILSCEKPHLYEQRKKHIESVMRKNDLIWHPISYTAKPPIFSTLYDIRKMQKIAREIVMNADNHITLLHCRSYIAAHVGVYCKKHFGIPWIFDMRGFWADERVDGGLWDTSRFLYKMVYSYFKNAEKKFISDTSRIISLTENGAQEIREWDAYTNANNQITVIPCCVDMQLFNYQKNKARIPSLRQALKISEDAFVLSYLGSIGTWYMADEMFDFFHRFYKKNPNSIFLFITPDSPDYLDSLALRKNVPRDVIRVVRANREDVPTYASLSNWSIFFIKPYFSKKASSPTKMGELLSLGIPILCNAGVGDVDSIMGDCPSGSLVSSFTIKEYDKAVDVLLADPHPERENLRNVAQKYYSLEKGISAYVKVYDELTC